MYANNAQRATSSAMNTGTPEPSKWRLQDRLVNSMLALPTMYTTVLALQQTVYFLCTTRWLTESTKHTWESSKETGSEPTMACRSSHSGTIELQTAQITCHSLVLARLVQAKSLVSCALLTLPIFNSSSTWLSREKENTGSAPAFTRPSNGLRTPSKEMNFGFIRNHNRPRRTGRSICEGCLVVITGHGPQAEVAQVFGHELLVELGGGRLEGLEEEQRNGEEKETGEENNHHTTHR